MNLLSPYPWPSADPYVQMFNRGAMGQTLRQKERNLGLGEMGDRKVLLFAGLALFAGVYVLLERGKG